ncbi:hypothetical protein BDV23DRAFT_183840 [Aspergillus alliaceus]|uniref:Uncharacterized protein n=1 Tax=Petromyces alliaceus TaxID=209559 RepID=A0A5N7C8I6_PETAA|nr:hypothetical protein BDV23DRAFT_183840 [Aspergillus alliaceus]
MSMTRIIGRRLSHLRNSPVLRHLMVRHPDPRRINSGYESEPIVDHYKPLADTLPDILQTLEIKDIKEEFHPELLEELSKLVKQRYALVELERVTLYLEEIEKDPVQFLSQECEARGIILSVGSVKAYEEKKWQEMDRSC